MWGLAFGRVGCFLNGCCWGGPCAGTVAEKWSVRFPFGSPAYVRQYQQLLLHDVPAPLITPTGSLLPAPAEGCGGCRDGHGLLGAESPQSWTRARRHFESLQDNYEYSAKLEPDSPATRDLASEVEAARKEADHERQTYQSIEANLEAYPSKEFPGQSMTPGELIQLARGRFSLPVHPAQLYAVISNLLAALFLAMLFRARRQHGIVFAAFLLIYPVSRVLLEMVRVDNPRDSFGLTISQFMSISIFAIGVITFLVMRSLPPVSPRAREWTPPPAEPQ
jgi:phosphatidylglycerol:prolipoprotein diacylglycerol transferase